MSPLPSEHSFPPTEATPLIQLSPAHRLPRSTLLRQTPHPGRSQLQILPLPSFPFGAAHFQVRLKSIDYWKEPWLPSCKPPRRHRSNSEIAAGCRPASRLARCLALLSHTPANTFVLRKCALEYAPNGSSPDTGQPHQDAAATPARSRLPRHPGCDVAKPAIRADSMRMLAYH